MCIRDSPDILLLCPLARALGTTPDILLDFRPLLSAVSYTHLAVYKRQVFYLSNISWDVLEMLQQRKFWQLFDGGVASCEVKLTKPDLRIYHCLLYTSDSS